MMLHNLFWVGLGKKGKAKQPPKIEFFKEAKAVEEFEKKRYLMVVRERE